jgi:hypothetical protein
MIEVAVANNKSKRSMRLSQQNCNNSNPQHYPNGVMIGRYKRQSDLIINYLHQNEAIKKTKNGVMNKEEIATTDQKTTYSISRNNTATTATTSLPDGVMMGRCKTQNSLIINQLCKRGDRKAKNGVMNERAIGTKQLDRVIIAGVQS